MKIMIAENIKKLREAAHMRQDELGKRIGVGGATISSWEHGRTEPNMGFTQALANVFNVTTDELIYGKSADQRLVLRVPLYDMISCGTGGFVDDQIIDYVVLPAEMFSPSKEYFAQYAHGDSMINANINDGDLIIFQKQSEPQNGMIGCFCIDENTATCKRLSISGTQIILLPENPAYNPIIVPVESFRCLGKLAFVVSDRRQR